MDTGLRDKLNAAGDIWPELPYEAWTDTLNTLHLWTQIVGKIKLKLSPFLNEWWNVAFHVTPRGMTTSTIPYGSRVFEINFDFLAHRLDVLVNDGSSRSIALRPQSVADFYKELMEALNSLGIQLEITTNPVEMMESLIPFDRDTEHASYDSEYVVRWWRILVQLDRLLQQFRAPFVGKSSPVLFWWGSFDLSETRFSGRPVPPQEWPARWMAEGSDQECYAAGFWPGNSKFPKPALFSYGHPQPPGLPDARIQPDAAYFDKDLGEFILPYDAVRTAPSPDRLVLAFYRSTYEATADLGGWDRAALERQQPH